MDHFTLQDGELYAEQVPLARIAEAVGTPCYIYSRATLERHARVFLDALKPAGRTHVAFAVKANPNLAVLRVLGRAGLGADVVSGGEIDRAVAAGIAPAEIVFSGVGKTDAELFHGIETGIGQFNIESEEEGVELAALAAARGLTVSAALRVNPDVDARTHAKISTGKAENKFGVPISDAAAIFARLSALEGLNLRGVAVHIGSMIADLTPMELAFQKVGALVGELRGAGHEISHVDLGGGVGVPYAPGDSYPSPADYGAMVARATSGWDVTLMFEPGRLIVGNAGVLLTRVVRVKRGVTHPFVILDAAMNDLARPSLYDAYHHFEAVRPSGERWTANLVGPVCETGDFIAKDRPLAIAQGDLLALRSAGAYGFVMSSNYNSRGRAAEIMVDGNTSHLVRRRETFADLVNGESVLP